MLPKTRIFEFVEKLCQYKEKTFFFQLNINDFFAPVYVCESQKVHRELKFFFRSTTTMEIPFLFHFKMEQTRFFEVAFSLETSIFLHQKLHKNAFLFMFLDFSALRRKSWLCTISSQFISQIGCALLSQNAFSHKLQLVNFSGQDLFESMSLVLVLLRWN